MYTVTRRFCQAARPPRVKCRGVLQSSRGTVVRIALDSPRSSATARSMVIAVPCTASGFNELRCYYGKVGRVVVGHVPAPVAPAIDGDDRRRPSSCAPSVKRVTRKSKLQNGSVFGVLRHEGCGLSAEVTAGDRRARRVRSQALLRLLIVDLETLPSKKTRIDRPGTGPMNANGIRLVAHDAVRVPGPKTFPTNHRLGTGGGAA